MRRIGSSAVYTSTRYPHSIRSGTSTMNKSDYLKIIGIAVLTVMCLWSAVSQFSLFSFSTASSSSSSAKTVSITTNYAVCDAVAKNPLNTAELVTQCREQVGEAFETSRSACNDYLTALNSCIKRASGSCRGQATALESCVDPFIIPTVDTWAGIAKNGPPGPPISSS